MAAHVICPCCKQRVDAKENYEKGVGKDDSFAAPCNTCAHREKHQTHPTCALCIHLI